MNYQYGGKMFLKPNYSQDLFKGTSNFYAQYRTVYTNFVGKIVYEDEFQVAVE